MAEHDQHASASRNDPGRPDTDALDDLERRITEAGKPAELLKAVEELLAFRADSRRRVLEVLNTARQEVGRHGPKAERRLVRLIGRNLQADEVDNDLIRDSRQVGWLSGIGSFRALMALRARKRWLVRRGKSLDEWQLNNKRRAHLFMDRLGVRRPRISPKTLPMEELKVRPGQTIKPATGNLGRGVYLVFAEDRIFHPRRSRILKSYRAMRRSMTRELKTRRVPRDEWYLEELICGPQGMMEPPPDVKFYCFYGRIGLAREICRHPEKLDQAWNREGEPIESGLEFDPRKRFEGYRVSEGEFQLAERISAAIPAPFIRIDFLRSPNGLVFGEFTPRPGSFARFLPEVDQRLGDLFLEAEARLQQDLLDGKSFRTFIDHVAPEEDGAPAGLIDRLRGYFP